MSLGAAVLVGALGVAAVWAASGLSKLDLAPPIAGLTVAEVRNTYIEIHSGHAHEAIDLMAALGTPVHAVVTGRVVKLFTSKAGGTTVYEFDEAREYCYYYAHLDRYAKGLTEGARVGRGDVIGYVGSTGNASPDAPHLHFAVFELGATKEWWKGTPINPFAALVEAAKRGK
jgi:murein DD-endopeptidase MepM/ murein hydrolase activator NlpD